jgi:hypothetical protein
MKVASSLEMIVPHMSARYGLAASACQHGGYAALSAFQHVSQV